MTPTDEAKKLVAETLKCTMDCDDTSKYQHPKEHFKSCPAYHRPAVESLVTRLLADRERIELEARNGEHGTLCTYCNASTSRKCQRRADLESQLAALDAPKGEVK